MENSDKIEKNDNLDDSKVEQFPLLEETYKTTKDVRILLKDKLVEIVKDMKINPDEKALQTQAKISIIAQLETIINDMDAQSEKREKLKLASKSNDSSENLNKLVTQFLYKLNPQNIKLMSEEKSNIEEAEKAIEAIAETDGVEILPGEMS